MQAFKYISAVTTVREKAVTMALIQTGHRWWLVKKNKHNPNLKKKGKKKKRKSKVWSEFLARLLRSGGFREKIKSDKEKAKMKNQSPD